MSRSPLLVLVVLAGFAMPAWADDPDDDDGDGYGESSGDCDDTNVDVYPGAEEVCDGLDNDCDGSVDEGTECADDDGDGFTEEEGDCDDTDMSIHPLATETVDGVDEDCDGLIDEDTSISDDDEDGYSEDEGDCDDGDSTRSPGETDWCRDGIDNDCDGSVDDPCEEHPEDGCDPGLSVDLWTSAFSGRPGAEVSAVAEPHTDDLALDPTVGWYVTGGSAEENGLEATWILPEEEGSYEVHVYIQDNCGTEAMDVGRVDVREDEEQITEAEVEHGGCGGGQAWVICLLPGLMGGSRRLTRRARNR